MTATIEEDAKLLEWIKELNSIQSMRESIRAEIDTLTKELHNIKAQKEKVAAIVVSSSPIAAVAAVSEVEVEVDTAIVSLPTLADTKPTQVISSLASETTSSLYSDASASTSTASTASITPSSSSSNAAALVKRSSEAELTTEALKKAITTEAATTSEAPAEKKQQRGSVIIHLSDEEGSSSSASSPSGSIIVKDIEDHSLAPVIQSIDKKELKANKEKKKAEDKEKRRSGSGHVWFGVKIDPQHAEHSDKDKGSPVPTVSELKKKKSSHSRSFSLGLPSVFSVKPGSPSVAKEPSKLGTEANEEETTKQKEKTSKKWFEKSDKSDKKKNKKGSKTDTKPEDEHHDSPFAGVPFHASPFAGVPFHTHVSPPPKKPTILAVASAATVSPSHIPFAMASMSDPTVSVMGSIESVSFEAVRTNSSIQAQLRVCIKIENESDDEFANLYLEKDKSSLANLKEKIATRYSKQPTHIDWVKMKNTRGRFVLITEEDIPNLETDQELIVRFV